MDMLEAILFLTAVTFVIAVSHSAIQVYAFYRRYRIRLQISNKVPSLHTRELAPDTIPLLPDPAPVAHSLQDTVLGSQRWPDYMDRRRAYTMSRPMPGSVSVNMNGNANPTFQSEPAAPRPFTNFGANTRGYPNANGVTPDLHPFERLATPDTISHQTSHTT